MMANVELLEIAPQEIERKSMEIIASEMGAHSFSEAELAIVKRCIHTSADFDYRDSLKISEGAIEHAIKVITEGCTFVTDTNMAFSGINKRVVSHFGGDVRCFMADEEVARVAKERGSTRATVCMEKAAELGGPVIVAIGNAPTALVRVCELIERGVFEPALVIGVPVGFVNVVESKNVLMQTKVNYIVAQGRKGGSNIAAAICNALLYLASNDERFQ